MREQKLTVCTNLSRSDVARLNRIVAKSGRNLSSVVRYIIRSYFAIADDMSRLESIAVIGGANFLCCLDDAANQTAAQEDK